MYDIVEFAVIVFGLISSAFLFGLGICFYRCPPDEWNRALEENKSEIVLKYFPFS